MSIDKQAFRQALGQFATGVCVMTMLDPDKAPVGVTASSFNSVSLDPPLILWSIDRSALSAKLFAEAGYFCVNILGSRQSEISNLFASRGKDKFSGTNWTPGLGGCPLIADSAASFQCRSWNVHDGGDHLIIIGEVLEFSCDTTASALVFYKGAYAQAVAQASSRPIQEEPACPGFVDNYLLYLLRQAHTCYNQDFYPRLAGFDITVQQWRVLTVIGDLQLASESQMLPLAGQPPAELALTCQGLLQRGLLRRDAAQWSLSDQGIKLCAKLVQMGQAHESDIVQRMAEKLDKQLPRGDTAAPIKQQLRAMLDALRSE